MYLGLEKTLLLLSTNVEPVHQVEYISRDPIVPCAAGNSKSLAVASTSVPRNTKMAPILRRPGLQVHPNQSRVLVTLGTGATNFNAKKKKKNTDSPMQRARVCVRHSHIDSAVSVHALRAEKSAALLIFLYSSGAGAGGRPRPEKVSAEKTETKKHPSLFNW